MQPFPMCVKFAGAVKFLLSLAVSLPVDSSHPVKPFPRAYPTYSTYLSLVYLFSYYFPPFPVFRRQYWCADESQHGIGFLSRCLFSRPPMNYGETTNFL